MKKIIEFGLIGILAGCSFNQNAENEIYSNPNNETNYPEIISYYTGDSKDPVLHPIISKYSLDGKFVRAWRVIKPGFKLEFIRIGEKMEEYTIEISEEEASAIYINP